LKHEHLETTSSADPRFTEETHFEAVLFYEWLLWE
jgi:hypothetical protein